MRAVGYNNRKPRTGRMGAGVRLTAAAAFVAIGLLSCTFGVDAPLLEVSANPAYPSRNVLLQYSITGAEGEVGARWSLRRYRPDLDEWELFPTWDTFVNTGVGAILELSDLDDGLYELTGELLLTRGGVTTVSTTDTGRAGFIVDTMAPWDPIDLAVNQEAGPTFGPPWDSSLALEVYPSYAGTVDPNLESPVQLHYVLDSTLLPTAQSEVAGELIQMWDNAGLPSSSRLLSIVAIDQAGNVGSRRMEIYSAP